MGVRHPVGELSDDCAPGALPPSGDGKILRIFDSFGHGRRMERCFKEVEHPMPVNPMRTQGVFLAAVEYQNAIDCEAAVDREFGTEVELCQRVESLLRANDEPDGCLDRPIVACADRFGGKLA
jgi:hypothetical protein